MTEVSTITGYTVTGPADTEMAVSKLVSYVITGPPVEPGALHIQTWTFTLDDHDFFVIQLVDDTLVYDFSTGQWHTFGNGLTTDNWNAALGQNWNTSLGAIMASLGGYTQSNIVVGDKENGALYFLDPALEEDDSSTGTAGNPFSRVVTGQLTTRGHNYVNCPAVELTSSTGESTGLSDLTVNLSISDDRGHSYWDAGTQTVTGGTYDVTLEWRSLGSFTEPGRLFRITDYGALYRIDGLDMRDEE